MKDEGGEGLPTQFDFEGTVIFITNTDFDYQVARENAMSPHFEALISRSMYIDLKMKTKKDYIVRIKQVVEAGMLREYNLSKTDEKEIVEYIESMQDKMRELSLRIVLKIAKLKKSKPTQWKTLARVVCTK
jgi:hypothetical protein